MTIANHDDTNIAFVLDIVCRFARFFVWLTANVFLVHAASFFLVALSIFFQQCVVFVPTFLICFGQCFSVLVAVSCPLGKRAKDSGVRAKHLTFTQGLGFMV